MKKNTTLVVLSVSTVISVVAAIVFLVLLLQSQQVIRRMQALQTEGIKNVATNEVVSQENAGGREEIIRLLNGRIQVQENGEWTDFCSLEELEQSDPVTLGRQKMQDIINQNKEALANGTLPEGVEERKLAQVELTVEEVVEKGQETVKKPAQSTGSQSTGTQPKVTPAPAAIAAPVATPVPDTNTSDDGGSDDGGSDSGSSDSGDSGNGSEDSGSDGGDGEDVGGQMRCFNQKREGTYAGRFKEQS